MGQQNIAVHSYDELLATDSDKASIRLLMAFKKRLTIHYDEGLLTTAKYDKGHYLIYDNAKVVAYTVIAH